MGDVEHYDRKMQDLFVLLACGCKRYFQAAPLGRFFIMPKLV